MKPVAHGDTGPPVVDIQLRLTNLGYLAGGTDIDGCFGRDTEKAVKAFQEACSVAPTGIVDQRTWWHMVERSYSLGERLLYLRWPFLRGSDVLHLQDLLVKLGFRVGPVDGIFGSATDKAVRDFQRNMLLPLDGIVGQNTLGSLSNLRNILKLHPRTMMPWTLTRRKEKLVFLAGREVHISYCKSEDSVLHKGRKNLAAQLGALLRLTGARVRVKGALLPPATEANEMLIGVGFDVAASTHASIALVCSSRSVELGALCVQAAEALERIAGRRVSTETRDSADLACNAVFLDMPEDEADLLADESLRQRIAVAIVDSLGRTAAEVEADKQANARDATIGLQNSVGLSAL